MINHARTLLLNSDGATRPVPTFFLEEYVDPKYAALVLPNYLNSAHAPLFGDGADEAYKNYMMRICTTVLHSTEFVEYVYALDPRVTYLNRPSVAGTKNSFVASPVNDLAKLGEAEVLGIPGEITQRAQWGWDIEILSGGPTVFSVQVVLRQPYARQVFSVSFDGSASELIPLPSQKQLFFRFKNSMTVGMQWSADAFILPKVSLADLVQACTKNGDAAGQLFGNTDPFKTFGELWSKHVYMNYRLSGYLLALAYRIEEIRLNGTR